jgi:hypothetical protein
MGRIVPEMRFPVVQQKSKSFPMINMQSFGVSYLRQLSNKCRTSGASDASGIALRRSKIITAYTVASALTSGDKVCSSPDEGRRARQ